MYMYRLSDLNCRQDHSGSRGWKEAHFEVYTLFWYISIIIQAHAAFYYNYDKISIVVTIGEIYKLCHSNLVQLMHVLSPTLFVGLCMHIILSSQLSWH